MAQPADISSLPKISSLQGLSLVNGFLNRTPELGGSSGQGRRGPRGFSGADGTGGDNEVDLTGILARLDALQVLVEGAVARLDAIEGRLDGFEGRLNSIEGRLDAASISCANGEVTLSI